MSGGWCRANRPRSSPSVGPDMRPEWNDKRLIDYVAQALSDLSGSIISVPATGPNDAAAIAILNARHDQERKATLAKYELAKSPFESNPVYKTVTWEETESECIALAEKGNYKPLFYLLLSPAARSALKESTWHLIVGIGTGKHKRPKKPPKQTNAERFNRNPVHQAAYLAPVVMRMLSSWFPEQKESVIKGRAIEIVADIKSVRESTLIEYLRRPKRDRHRLSD
jgi:hypothetical protein